MFGFEKLDVWHKAVDPTLQIDEVLKKLPKDELYSSGDQLRRTALAISTNIAEGTGRNSKKEASYFFQCSKRICLWGSQPVKSFEDKRILK